MSVVNRERRKNAGKRMAVLGAKMAEEDEAFWSHDTWADDDSGNESFHESDEDSALRKDVFDSDFNDSESDNEEDEVAAGEAEERELRKSERASKINNNAYKQPGGHKRRRGFPGVGKRVLGEGFNAGIVLNLPPASHDSLAYLESIEANRRAYLESLQTQQSTPTQPAAATATDTKTTPIVTKSLAQPIAPPAPPPPLAKPAVTIKAKGKTKPVPVRKQTRASKAALQTKGVRKLRGRGEAPTTQAAPSRKVVASGSDTTARAKRRKFAQEELLLEAVHDTEPENQRWLHGRKRVQDQHNQDNNSNVLRDRYRGKKVVQKFHSRRGCLITLTFPEMDAVPEILTRRQERQKQQHPPIKQETSQVSPLPTSSLPQQQASSRCVITGKSGKYKDPLTKYPYHDLAAFRELRRRHKEGIAIVTRPVVTVGSEGATTKKTPVPASRKKKVVKKKPTVASGGNIKNATIVKQVQGKLPSSSTTALPKLPFQSPKPPSRPSTNGSKPSNANTIATNPQQQNSAVMDKIGFSWGTKPKGTTSPASPRRLSPRKWKPTEKVLETISTDGSVPRGLGIQPKLPPAPSLSTPPIPDNTTSKSAIGQAPVVATSASALAKTSPPVSSRMQGKAKIPTAPIATIQSNLNGGPPASTVKTPSAESCGTNGHSKEKLANDSNRAVPISKTKESAPNGNGKSGDAGDEKKNANILDRGIKGKPEPIQ